MTIPPPEPSNPYQAPYSSVPPPPPPGAPYGYPPPPPPQSGRNGLALAGMITGIVSVVLACCCGWFSLPVGAVAIVLSVIGMNQIKQTGQEGRPFAIAGIATGAASIVLAIVGTVFDLANTDIFNRFN